MDNYTSCQNIIQEKIYTKSKELFLRNGIRNVTMEDIAKELGISKKTIYQFVENKADLVLKSVHYDIDSIEKDTLNICSNSENAVDEMLKIGYYIAVCLDKFSPGRLSELEKFYPESWQLVEKHQNGFVIHLIQENLKKGIEQNLYRKEIDLEKISLFYINGSNFVLTLGERFPEKKMDFPQYFRAFLEYHLRAILTDIGLKHFINFSYDKTT